MGQPTCILCAFYHPQADPHAPDHGWLTCPAGQRRLEHELLSIRAAYARLDEQVAIEAGARDAVSRALPGALTPSPSNQPHVTGTREPRLPINVERIDLLLPVITGYVQDLDGDQYGHHSVATVLNEWVAGWHDRWFSNESYPRLTAPHLIDWILTPRLRLICQHETALPDFAEELRELRGRLRGALGEATKKPIVMWGISCPRCKMISQLTLDPEDPDHYRECGNCGLLLSRDEYLRHLRKIVESLR